jgi:fused signal recognition particle receptor
MGTSELNNLLRDEIAALLEENNSDDVENFDLPQSGEPYVIMIVGVNGVGKQQPSGNWPTSLKKPGKKWYWAQPIHFELLRSTSCKFGPTA